MRSIVFCTGIYPVLIALVLQEGKLLSLIEKWLASIPGDGKPPRRAPGSLTELQFQFPEQVVNETVRWAGNQLHVCGAHICAGVVPLLIQLCGPGDSS